MEKSTEQFLEELDAALIENRLFLNELRLDPSNISMKHKHIWSKRGKCKLCGESRNNATV